MLNGEVQSENCEDLNEFRDKELYISRQQQSHQLTKVVRLVGGLL